MTQQHPITPPPELMSKWCYEDGEEIKSSPRWFFSVCAKAAQWGADQELEACCEWFSADRGYHHSVSSDLRAGRRPKPPSLKEQALDLLDKAEDPSWDINDFSIVRRALEALPD